MYLVDMLHRRGIGVILDWVPSHFPDDAHGLARFDGTHLYEHADPRQGFHPEWKSCIFNYGRNEVRAFLLVERAVLARRATTSTACASTPSRRCSTSTTGASAGEWVPNAHGGKREPRRDRVPARSSTRRCTATIPDAQTIAEESTAWPMVSRPTYVGGLGFGMKWNMGWMHDTLDYLQHDPVHRKYHHDELTFSHLVRVHRELRAAALARRGRATARARCIGKMPGDDWQQFANLRLLFGYMWAHPGKKLLFMGGEFGQRREWTHDGELDWWRAAVPASTPACSAGSRDLNRAVSRASPRCTSSISTRDGFEWVDTRRRRERACSRSCAGRATATPVLVVCNFTPVPRTNYRLGVPRGGYWRELLNSDAPVLRRQRHGQLRRRRRGADAGARPLSLADADAAAARVALPASRIAMPIDAKATDAQRPNRALRRPRARRHRGRHARRSTAAASRSSASSATTSSSRPTASPTATTCVACVLLLAARGATRVAAKRRCARSATTAGAARSPSTQLGRYRVHRRGWVDAFLIVAPRPRAPRRRARICASPRRSAPSSSPRPASARAGDDATALQRAGPRSSRAARCQRRLRAIGARRRARAARERYPDRRFATSSRRELPRRRRPRARAVLRAGTSSSRARRRDGRARTARFARLRGARCRTSRRWASTCSTCRRSIRSAATERKGTNNALERRAGRRRQPVGDRRDGGRAQGDPSRARHARRLPRARRRGARRTASRSRSTSPSSARPTIRT